MQKIAFLPKAFNDLKNWAEEDKRILLKIFEIIIRCRTQSVFGNRQARTFET